VPCADAVVVVSEEAAVLAAVAAAVLPFGRLFLSSAGILLVLVDIFVGQKLFED